MLNSVNQCVVLFLFVLSYFRLFLVISSLSGFHTPLGFYFIGLYDFCSQIGREVSVFKLGYIVQENRILCIEWVSLLWENRHHHIASLSLGCLPATVESHIVETERHGISQAKRKSYS